MALVENINEGISQGDTNGHVKEMVLEHRDQEGFQPHHPTTIASSAIPSLDIIRESPSPLSVPVGSLYNKSNSPSPSPLTGSLNNLSISPKNRINGISTPPSPRSRTPISYQLPGSPVFLNSTISNKSKLIPSEDEQHYSSDGEIRDGRDDNDGSNDYSGAAAAGSGADGSANGAASAGSGEPSSSVGTDSNADILAPRTTRFVSFKDTPDDTSDGSGYFDTVHHHVNENGQGNGILHNKLNGGDSEHAHTSHLQSLSVMDDGDNDADREFDTDANISPSIGKRGVRNKPKKRDLWKRMSMAATGHSMSDFDNHHHLSNDVAPDSITSNNDETNGISTPIPLTSSTPKGPVSGNNLQQPQPTRRLHKLRSKSDAEVLKSFGRDSAKGHIQSENRRDRENENEIENDNENEVDSDAEVTMFPPRQGGYGSSSVPDSNRVGGARRKFMSYVGPTSMAELFHTGTSVGVDGAAAAAAAASGGSAAAAGLESTPGATPSANFKRRFSQFNPELLGSGISRNFKNTLRMNFGRKKKEELINPEEYQKSAELITELFAMAPAATIFASGFQRDEKNLRRVPVLLEQLRFNITDLGNRSFKIDLEYGSGPARLSWSVTKDYKDFVFLHTRLKTMNFQATVFNTGRMSQRLKFPKLPKPRHHSGKGRRGSVSRLSISQGHSHGGGNDNNDLIRQNTRNTINTMADDHDSLFSMTSRSTAGSHSDFEEFTAGDRSGVMAGPHSSRSSLAVALTEYVTRLLRILRFRADANKLLQFLELSNMSIRLAPEHAFHGKEGMLYVRSFASVQGWRVSHWRPEDLGQMIQRHTSKWFMVRHSYILCVDNITSTNVLEVFLVDRDFYARKHISSSDSDDEGGVSLTTADHETVQGTVPDSRAVVAASSSERAGSGSGVVVKQNNAKAAAAGGATTGSSLGGAARFFLEIENGERTLKMAAKSEKEIANWIESINLMKSNTDWSNRNIRFGSYAPVRHNVRAQWFVDGRDYFWAVSEAIDMAKDVIYIHDWWLSPELYLRRPPQDNQEWRIDRLLKRKAEQGVKIFVIIYRNVGQTIPIDSLYTKHSLLDLHENIYVMRSPNQWLQNTYFWAHHEKLCLIDHTVSFLGGIDMCFGRYDTPDHVLTDDKRHAFYNDPDQQVFDDEGTQMWPGKDYSNPRVQDFFQLDHPYDDMYDRHKVPRMPWHDVHMMVVGQPARDLVRHFVQRWNYLLRQKRPSRNTPLLLPPPDYTPDELNKLGLAGTCEVQILRSSAGWSLGLKEHEQSIQSAYLKSIESSLHFVYIENQFFITSTSIDGIKIENKIGDALLERIIRAHQNGENWRAIIVIPLMPGFESQVDLKEGSSVRVIMQCQYLSISRGPYSLFSRLQHAGINPDDYIQFFSLRKWGKIGPNKKLITEQLYIHGKIMIVDDQIAIIGSANINERSMRGNRDSEVAAVIRDSHQIESLMGGEPFRVGKFAHTLRIRLMREHLGVDVDTIDLIERQVEELASTMPSSGAGVAGGKGGGADSSNGGSHSRTSSGASFMSGDNEVSRGETTIGGELLHTGIAEHVELHSFNNTAGVDNIGMRDVKSVSYDSRVQNNTKHKLDVEGLGQDGYAIAKILEERRQKQQEQKRDSIGEESIVEKAENTIDDLLNRESISDITDFKRRLYEKMTNTSLEDDFSKLESPSSPSESDTGSTRGSPRAPTSVDPYKFRDPLDDSFYFDIWLSIAQRNTNLFREVFRCQPDDEVTTWREYKEYVAYGEKFSNSQDAMTQQPLSSHEATLKAHAPLGTMGMEDDPPAEAKVTTTNTSEDGGTVYDMANPRDRTVVPTPSSLSITNQRPRRRRANTRSSRKWHSGFEHVYDSSAAEKILQGIRGNLVLFPADWLARELET